MSWAVIDCETDPFQHGRVPTPFVWGYLDRRGFRSCWSDDPEEWIEFLRTDTTTTLYAHNGGRFDFHFLLEYLDPEAEILMIRGSVAKAKIKDGPVLLDSSMILPIPLAAYQKDTIDYALMEPDRRDANKAEIIDYLESDCWYLHHLIDAFHSEHGKALTLAQAALRKWRQIDPRARARGEESFDRLFRPYYHGGRCEAFRLGEYRRGFSSVDINSAYPHAMLDEHPWGMSVRRTTSIRDDEWPRAFVKVEAHSHGALPFVGNDGSLWFPHSSGTYSVTGWEILAGLETGTLRIDRILDGWVFDETINFREFVEKYYKRKREAKERGQRAEELVAKLTLNSLYGKLAQDPTRHQTHHLTTQDDVQRYLNDGYELGGQLGPWWVVQRPKTPSRGAWANVATAASITGHVRARLWRDLLRVSDPIYCDTDSIAARGVRDLTMGEGLGAWKVEGRYSYGAIGGKKLYAFWGSAQGWKTASKGVRLEPEEIVDIARGNEVVWSSDAPTFRFGQGAQFLSRSIKMRVNNP